MNLRRALHSIPLYHWFAGWYRRNITYGEYQQWIRRSENSTATVGKKNPLISIIVPTYKYQERYLRELIESVVAQTYANWELCIVNACDNERDRVRISEMTKSDSRIREVMLERNLHIAGNTNAGIEAAKGEYIGLLDADDTLAPFALAEVVARLQGQDMPDAFYSDEDKLSDDGKYRSFPFFKPDLNLEMLLTSNYICHFLVLRSALLKRLKIREGFNGAQDYDLVLRLCAEKARFCHIPAISYHWRLADGSTAVQPGQKSYASEAGRRALVDYLRSTNTQAEVEVMKGQDTAYEVHYVLAKEPNVLILAEDSDRHVISDTTDYSNYRFGEVGEAAEYIVHITRGIVPVDRSWLNELIAKAAQPGAGVIGAKVDMPGGTFIRGYQLDRQGGLQPLIAASDGPTFGYDGLSTWPRAVLLPPPMVIAYRAEIANSADAQGLIALSLTAARLGLRNVFWPASHLRATGTIIDQFYDKKNISDFPPDPLFHPSLTVKSGRTALHI